MIRIQFPVKRRHVGKSRSLVLIISMSFGLLFLSAPIFSQQYIADYTVAKEEVLRSIPVEYISKAKAELVVAYQHTSHGTHVSRGMFGLQGYKAGDDTLFGISSVQAENLLEFRDFAMEDYAPSGVDGADLSRDETAFIQTTRNYLDATENATVNVVMWAWSRIEGHDVAGNYLPGMDSLISEYGPGGTKIGTGSGLREVPVHFIYMTGHAIKDANTGALNPMDQAALIVDHCKANQLFCHEYYTIDTHTMDDIYYEDTGDNGDSDTYGGNFYEDWQNSHTLGVDYYENWQTIEGYVTYGVHTTQHITSNRKAYAMWWILARLVGWDDAIPVTSITISTDPDTTQVMTGDTLQFLATVEPDTASNQELAWSVINGDGSATISSEDLLSGGQPGSVQVVALAMDGSGVADTMDITIIAPPVPVTDISLSTAGDLTSIDEGSTLQCSASVLPADATNRDVLWSVHNLTGSAQIDVDGLLTGLSEGTVEVIATAEDGSQVADTVQISIIEVIVLVTDIDITSAGDVTSIDEGSTLQCSANVLPADASDPSLEWSLVNGSGSATISSGGLVSALGEGTVEVVATALDGSDISGSLSLTINGPDALFEETYSKSIRLYPNPGTDRFYIEDQQYSIEKLSVFDGNGREILVISPGELTSRISIDLTGNSPGIYYLRVRDSNQNLYHSKLVLIN